MVLHNEALPFYQAQGIAVKAVLTDNGTEFCGTPERRPQSKGFVARFNRTVHEAFFQRAWRKKLYIDSVKKET